MTDRVAVLARFLASQLDWMRHRPEVDEFARDIADCAGRIRGVVNGPREQRYLGPCGAFISAVDDVTMDQPKIATCEGDVYAPRGGSTGRCRDCGAKVAAEDRRAWLDAQIRSEAFTALEIAQAYDIPVKTIRSWATDRPEVRDHEGKLLRSATPARLRSYWRTTAGLIAPWSNTADDLDAPRLHYAGDVLDLAAADAARRAGEQAKRQRRKDTAA